MAIKGLETVLKNLNTQIAMIGGRTLGGLLYAAEIYVRKPAQKKCPVVTGNLRNSAFVAWGRGAENPSPRFKNPPGKPNRAMEMKSQHKVVIAEEMARMAERSCTCVVGFSAVYATKTHENPRAGKTGGVSPSGKKYTAGRTAKGYKSKRKVFSTVGEWKFLESTLKENTPIILETIRQRAQIP